MGLQESMEKKQTRPRELLEREEPISPHPSKAQEGTASIREVVLTRMEIIVPQNALPLAEWR